MPIDNFYVEVEGTYRGYKARLLMVKIHKVMVVVVVMVVPPMGVPPVGVPFVGVQPVVIVVVAPHGSATPWRWVPMVLLTPSGTTAGRAIPQWQHPLVAPPPMVPSSSSVSPTLAAPPSSSLTP